MGIPEEDRGPQWLRDYGSGSQMTSSDTMTGWVDSSALLVNPETMKELAEKLELEHISDYIEHLKVVFERLRANPGQGEFPELYDVLDHHRTLIINSMDVMREHDYAVMKFVGFAKEMADRYNEADTENSIRLGDVQANLAAGTPEIPGAPGTETEQQPAGTTGTTGTTGDGTTTTEMPSDDLPPPPVDPNAPTATGDPRRAI
jgi:hypothetical protein